MGVFDQAARYAARMEPDAVLSALLGEGHPVRFLDWFDTRSLPMPGGPDRAADLIAECEDGEGRLLAVLEFQSSHDPEKLDVTLLEAAILRVHARYGQDNASRYRVLTALIYLRDACPQSILDMRVAGRGTLHEAFVWDIGTKPARDALDKVDAGEVSWGTLFWVPLMDGGTDADVIGRWKGLVERLAPSSKGRDELIEIARTFVGLIGRIPEWERVMTESLVTESEYINRWIDRARLQEAKQILRDLVRDRFPEALTPEVEAAIADQPSHDLLRSWVRACGQSPTADAFLAALRR